MYTSANLLVNIFNETGWVLREIQGGARSLVVHGLYVIDSSGVSCRHSYKLTNSHPLPSNLSSHLSLAGGSFRKDTRRFPPASSELPLWETMVAILVRS